MDKEYRCDIYDSLLEYVQDKRYNQAVLIDGDWGSGKTWFIKNVFIPRIKEIDSNKWHIVYISLYGIQSIDQLEKRLKDVLAEKVLKKWLLEKWHVHKTISVRENLVRGILNSITSMIELYTPVKNCRI